jgi:hypothetical protein
MLLSFRKTDWALTDYPIAIRTQPNDCISESRVSSIEKHPYVARVVKWGALSASGITAADAKRQLAIRFGVQRDYRQREGRPLPRPGTAVAIEFAPQERVDAYGELKDDFVRRVPNLDWAFISDESSLWDFHTDTSNQEVNAKVTEVYRVDVSDIQSGNLADILERIAVSRL